MRNAAVLSNDPIMIESFLAPPTLIGPGGKEYPNPVADLHLQSSIHCVYPDWFKGVEDHLLLARAKEVPPGHKASVRDSSKVLNFHEIYLGSAASLAERNNIPLALAKEWDALFKKSYARYFEWAAEVARIDVNRGFSVNARGRSRWINSSSPA